MSENLQNALTQLTDAVQVIIEEAKRTQTSQSAQEQEQKIQSSAQSLSKGEYAVVAVRKDTTSGDIIAFKLNSGDILDYATCVDAVNQGLIPSLRVGLNREGEPSIRGVADGNPDNNLQNLPQF